MRLLSITFFGTNQTLNLLLYIQVFNRKATMKNLLITIIIIFLNTAIKGQQDRAKIPWKIESSPSFSYFKGIIKKSDFTYEQSIQKEDSIHEFSLNYSFTYGELNRSIYNREHVFSLTYDYQHHDAFSPFTGVFITNNRFTGFDLRASYFLGMKATFLRNEKANLSFSFAGQIEQANFAAPPDLTQEQAKNAISYRLSLRPKFIFKSNDEIWFQSETYYQPTLRNFRDYIVQSRNTITLPLIQHFSINLIYQWFFNNKPIYNNILRDDQRFQIGFKYRVPSQSDLKPLIGKNK